MGKYDAAISCLHGSLAVAEAGIGVIDKADLKAAIRFLEAAAKVDKEAALAVQPGPNTHSCTLAITLAVMTVPDVYDQIRALLEALPDKGGE